MSFLNLDLGWFHRTCSLHSGRPVSKLPITALQLRAQGSNSGRPVISGQPLEHVTQIIAADVQKLLVRGLKPDARQFRPLVHLNSSARLSLTGLLIPSRRVPYTRTGSPVASIDEKRKEIGGEFTKCTL